MLVVDKPSGPTSHDVVDHVRRALGERRVGHTGTLDPFATGVLPVCVGQATRLARFFTDGEKTYRATIRLGFATSTDDFTGEPVHDARPVEVADAVLREACARLVGTLPQVPPAYSAKRVDGERLYEAARAGRPVQREAVLVTVHALEVLAHEGDRVEIEVRCAPGTYVRALARDLGEALGVGGHLTTLRRTRSGGFGLDSAIALNAIGPEWLIPLDALFTDWPCVHLDPPTVAAVGHGRDVGEGMIADAWPSDAPHVRMLDTGGRLVAVAVPRGGGHERTELPVPRTLHPEIVFSRGAGSPD